ncbi:DUF4249 domain-containing protein [uncultured Aquimarina sp.]|uniref:DUF4249 domain-containing protein n=1 Tax=uncultured Aquimarina sp. TaxID=575652 RepID=UPI0026240485|nr:DUF4249 domain-containing protein [uncultured Aquimarina sp.]
MNSYTRHIGILFLLISFVLLFGCTESFEIENDRIENFLVINATVTDKVSNQRIVLSRTFGFEESEPIPEEGASIVIIENNVTEYQFNENSPGEYYSVQEFGVTAGNEYKLIVRTANGRSYSSQKVIAPQPTSIERVYVKRMINDQGTEGVGVFLDTFDLTGNSLYYRYEFEETYRIVAPLWISFDIVSQLQAADVVFSLVERPQGQRVCYKTELSKNINVVNTSGFTEDRIQDLMINFIPADDIRVADRYSILVKQYVQTKEAQAFYKVLSDFSGSETVFSQIQPGFIRGNIVSETDGDENVVGFFDVSSLTEQRVFFNRGELIGDLPVYMLECQEFVPEPSMNESVFEYEKRLHFTIAGSRYKLASSNLNVTASPPAIRLIPRACGDCTAIGNSEVPGFWVD